MIKLIVLDVDGTLSDGTITYTNEGEESKSFNVKDGLALASWTKKFGKKALIITGRSSKIVEKRAHDLGIKYVFQGIKDKVYVLDDFLKKNNISWDEIACIGDDLNDYAMLKKAGFSFCPADASHYIKDLVKIVCKSNGGEGAVREMMEEVFRNEKLEEEFLNLWQ